jgi:hypothetical protein
MKPAFVLMLMGALMWASNGAQAHPSFQVREASIGGAFKAVMAIPHGCDGSPTVKVRVQIPEGFIGVKPMPKPGWSITTVRGSYAKAYPFYHGRILTEGVREIIWSGRLLDDHFDEFTFLGFLAESLPTGQMLYFPAYQECEQGAYHWTEVPAAGESGHTLATPAPGIRLIQMAGKSAASRSYKTGALVIENPWARATPGGAQVAGGFMRITNTGQQPERLIGGTLALATDVEVHEMTMVDNVMRMRRLANGLEIKPGESVELKPGGYHVMFMALKGGLIQGQRVKGTLVFEKAGTVEVEFEVAPIGAQSGSGHH